MYPPAPAFGTLRLARLSDLTRIGIVAAAGFYHSSWFLYERPYYKQYPFDTLSSYRDMYRKAILDPSCVVLVAEDKLQEDEVNNVYDALAEVYPPFKDQIPPESLRDGKAIVGVAGLKLEAGSKREGQFQPDSSTPKIPDDEVRNRDRNSTAGKLFEKATHDREAQLFKGRMVIDTMVVHPAYWRQSHGTNLSKWFLELADMDKKGLGVAGAPMGKLLFTKLGFKEAEVIEVPGYEEHPKPVHAWLGLRNASVDEAYSEHPGLTQAIL